MLQRLNTCRFVALATVLWTGLIILFLTVPTSLNLSPSWHHVPATVANYTTVEEWCFECASNGCSNGCNRYIERPCYHIGLILQYDTHRCTILLENKYVHRVDDYDLIRSEFPLRSETWVHYYRDQCESCQLGSGNSDLAFVMVMTVLGSLTTMMVVSCSDRTHEYQLLNWIFSLFYRKRK